MTPISRFLNRSSFIRLLVFLIGAVFIVRLFYLQVIHHDYYEAQALKEHITKFTIPAERGLIYAYDGQEKLAPLVLNESVYTVYADPRYVSDADKTANVLRKVAGGNVVKNFEDGLKNKDLQYVVLARQVTKDQVELINKEGLAGVGFQSGSRRVYPEGRLAAQLLGYVNNEGQGQYGLEQFSDKKLAGQNGVLKAVTDVHGIPISLNEANVQIPAKHGNNLALTIDRNVQAYAEQALEKGLKDAKASHGSAIVMDPNSGAILAMANNPTYDPSKYNEVQDYKVFSNSVVSDPYEAGSAIKSLTMAIGLNEGVVSPESTYYNSGSVQVDDALIKNVLNVNGTRTMTEVLEYSLNTGVVHVLSQLGGGEINKTARDKLYGYFSGNFMFGKLTGVEQSSESAGRIISPEEMQGNNVRYANMTFGQGMDTTMLQVASAFSAAINGGSYYQPRLVDGTVDDDGRVKKASPKILKTDVVKNSTSDQLKSMLQAARSKSFIGVDRPGYKVGGKTGTSQIIDPETGKYVDDNAIGTYVGFGGNNTPSYVIMVRVVDAKIGGYAGSMAAAPIFADISNWMIDYQKIQPIR